MRRQGSENQNAVGRVRYFLMSVGLLLPIANESLLVFVDEGRIPAPWGYLFLPFVLLHYGLVAPAIFLPVRG